MIGCWAIGGRLPDDDDAMPILMVRADGQYHPILSIAGRLPRILAGFHFDFRRDKTLGRLSY